MLYLHPQKQESSKQISLKLRRKQVIAKQLTIRPFRGREKEQPNRINEKIKGLKEVRLVGDNVEQGVFSYEEAIRIADQLELDLVEISPNAVPPVCKIVDYQKFLYHQKKREKEQKAKSSKVILKAYVFFKGRSILFKSQGEQLLARFATDLEDYAKVDQLPQLEGKRMIIMFSPKKTTK